jgi:hypothetical protein
VAPQPPAGPRRPTYAELVAERNRLAEEGRKAEARLLRLRGELDDLAAELARNRCSPEERAFDERMVAGFRTMLPAFVEGRVSRGFVRGFYEAWRSDTFVKPRTPVSRRPSLRDRELPADPEELAVRIVKAGEKRRAETGPPLPDDPVARAIVLAGYKRRNEKPPL